MSIESVIAANRFGLGARPGELSRIDSNPQGWLLDQLQGPSREYEDIRSIFKGVLAEHLEIPPGYLDKIVFPGSSAAAMTEGLILS